MLRILALALALCGGCAARSSHLAHRLESTEPLERIRAIQEVADDDREEYLAALVDRLDDPDQAVRFYAILALERMTGTRRGYRYAAPASERREAVAAWRAFVIARAADGQDTAASHGSTGPAEGPGIEMRGWNESKRTGSGDE